jgi:hypothetical protein
VRALLPLRELPDRAREVVDLRVAPLDALRDFELPLEEREGLAVDAFR